MKKILIFLLVVVSMFSSCKKDDDESTYTPKGDLNVIVTINGYMVAEGADVYTKPPTKQGITDQFGSTLLLGLPVGSLEVFASLDSIGSGKSVVNIQASELAETQINIIPGVNVGLAPTISNILPNIPAQFAEGEQITFSVHVEDNDSPPQDLVVRWESDLDGLLKSVVPTSSGDAGFQTSNLSKGMHEITVTAEDKDGYYATLDYELSTMSPLGVELAEPVKEDGNVILSWSEYAAGDFLRYEVFRTDENCTNQNEELIATITEKTETTFTDKTAPFVYQSCYYIRVTNTENLSRNSNYQTVELPGGEIFNFEPYNMLRHPSQPYIYLLDRGGQKIIKFNYDLMQVEGELNVPGNIGHCDIGENGFGVEIYAPGHDGWIYVYDADNLTQTTSIMTGLPTTSVVINGLGHVIAAVMPSPWWEQPVRTYDRATGINLDGNGDFDGDRLRMIPGKNEIISISTSVSPVDMEYFRLGETGMIELHQDDPYHGDYPLDPSIFRISDDGTYSITSRYGAVYLANESMEYRGELQRGALLFSDYAFSDDGSVIYAATSNRKSIQIGHYPSLIRDGEILTRGFPIFITRDGNRIIAVSQSEESSMTVGVEIVQLDR